MNIWIIGICVVILTTLYYRWMFGYWKSRNVKTLPPNLLFGNLTDVLLGRIPGFRMFEKAYKTSTANGYKYIGYYFLGKPILVATDLDLIKKILITDFTSFCDREFYLDKENDRLSNHLVAMRGADWKHMRGLLSPAFTASKLRNVYPILSSVSEQLKSILDAAYTEPVNIKDIGSKFVFDSVSNCIFGLETNALKDQNLELRYYAKRVAGGDLVQQIKVLLTLVNPNVLYFLRIPFNSYDVQKFFLNLTKTTVKQREENNMVREDIMHLLIQLRNNVDIEDSPKDTGDKGYAGNKNGTKSLTIQEIAAQTLMFFVVGHESTSTTVTNAIYELLCNESVLEKALLEVNTVIKNHHGKITYEALNEMTYLENIINETIRMYPVLPVLSRVCTNNYKIPDSELILKKGTVIFIPSYEILQDPNIFQDPEKFIPERFAVGSNLKFPHKISWLGFGDGPRRCIGERFGILMAKVFLSTILYHYKISFNYALKLPLKVDKNNMIATLKDDLLVDLRRTNL